MRTYILLCAALAGGGIGFFLSGLYLYIQIRKIAQEARESLKNSKDFVEKAAHLLEKGHLLKVINGGRQQLSKENSYEI
jgi:hypothetical protein